MEDNIVIPGNWLLDPLLRGRYMNKLVSIKKEFVSDLAVIQLHELKAKKIDIFRSDPWWVSNDAMVEEYNKLRKIYEPMDNATRELTIKELEKYIGLQCVNIM